MGGLLLLKKPGVALPLDPSLALKYPFALTGLEGHLPSGIGNALALLLLSSEKLRPRLVPELGLLADDVPL